jgi:hypothetical protein
MVGAIILPRSRRVLESRTPSSSLNPRVHRQSRAPKAVAAHRELWSGRWESKGVRCSPTTKPARKRLDEISKSPIWPLAARTGTTGFASAFGKF